MRNSPLLFTFIFSVFLMAHPCYYFEPDYDTGLGDVVEQNIELPPFTDISLNINAEVIYIKGNDQKVDHFLYEGPVTNLYSFFRHFTSIVHLYSLKGNG